jgi:hypothetical protein
MNRVLIVASLIVALALATGCSKKSEDSKKQAQDQKTMPGGAAVQNAVAGIHWTVPQNWTAQPEKPMRAATYLAPAAKEKTEPGDCGVFYFGNGQGGTVEDNLSRWISQFERGGKHEFAKKEINGLQVTTIQISGTYLAPAGPAMESQGKKEDYRLLGAIVEAPQGLVFFKFTGPAETINANQAAFNQLVDSIIKS